MEEVVTHVMKVNKATELFQTMAIMSMNMGNLTLKVNIMKNKFPIGEKEKAMLQEELDKERDFQKGYKHDVEIWRENMAELNKKIKFSLKNYRMKMRSSRVAYHGLSRRMKNYMI